MVYPELREVETYRDVPDGVRLEDILPPVMWHGVQERFVQERRWDVSPFSEGSAEFRHRVVTVVEGILAPARRARTWRSCATAASSTPTSGTSSGLDEDMFFRPGARLGQPGPGAATDAE